MVTDTETAKQVLLRRRNTQSDKLVAKINEKALKKMHSSKDRYWHARGIIEPLANEQVKIRPRIAAPSEDLMEESIDSVVMDIALELGGSGLDE